MINYVMIFSLVNRVDGGGGGGVEASGGTTRDVSIYVNENKIIGNKVPKLIVIVLFYSIILVRG